MQKGRKLGILNKFTSIILLMCIFVNLFSVFIENASIAAEIYSNDEKPSNIIEDNDKTYSEEYSNYLELSEEEKSQYEIIPEKYDISIEEFEKAYNEEETTSINLTNDLSFIDGDSVLPSSYDMRRDIEINVENQEGINICWCFAALGTLRTYLAKHGYNNGVTPDFSEWHMNYLTSKYYSKGSGRELNSGGNFKYALQYFKYNDGPIFEETFPFGTDIDVNDETQLQNLDDYKSKYYVHGVVSFPTITKKLQSDGTLKIYNGKDEITENSLESIRNKVKEQIINNGGVYCSIRTNKNFGCDDADGTKNYFDDGSLTNEIAQANGSKIGSHGMTIIGWDDNHSKENFISKDANGNAVKPKNDGAYLILNSAGADWNGDGCMWISYDDYGIERALSGITSADNIEKYNTYTFKNESGYNAMKSVLSSEIGDITIDDNSKAINVLDLVVNEITDLDMKEMNLTDEDINDIFKYELPKVTNLNLDGNKISNINQLQLPNYNMISLLNQNVSKTIKDTLTFEYPSLIVQAKESSSKLYSSSDLTFFNCQENSDKGGITITNPLANEIYIKINSGNAAGTKINLNVIDTLPPEVKISGTLDKWEKSHVLTINATDKVSGLQTIKINGKELTLKNGDTTYTINKNGTYELTAIDNIGNQMTRTIAVDNIIEKMGDINKDNKINISDVIAVIRHIGAKEGSKYYLNDEKRAISDINEDGKINIADVIGIIRLVSSK